MMDEEEYFRVVEGHFLQKRGNPMPLFIKEYLLIREWYDNEFPIEVVIRGIDRAFEKKKDEQDDITSLLYCRRFVKGEYKRHLKSMEGDAAATGGPELPAGDIEQYLERITEQLSQSVKKAVDSGNSALSEMLQMRESELRIEVLEPFRSNPLMDRQRVEEKLTGIEKRMEQLLIQMMPPNDLNSFKEDSMRELKAFEEKLEFSIYQEMLNRSLIKAIRKQYNIPRLSLFYM